MTIRVTVSLPDELHDDLVRIADGSHISISAVIRTVLADTVPRMTSVLRYLGTVTPEQAPGVSQELDAWAEGLRTLMQSAPEALGPFRDMLDKPPADADE